MNANQLYIFTFHVKENSCCSLVEGEVIKRQKIYYSGQAQL